MRCRYSFDDIFNYFDGIMSEEMKGRFAEHMQSCGVCRNYFTSLVLTKRYIEEKVTSGKDFREAVLQSIDTDKYRGRKVKHAVFPLVRKLGAFLKPGAAAAAVCACLITLFLGAVSLKDYIEFTHGSTASTADRSIETEHLIISYDGLSIGSIENIASILEKNYVRVSKDLDYQSDTNIDVRLWSDKAKLITALGDANITLDADAGYSQKVLHLLAPSVSGGVIPENFGLDHIAHMMIIEINPDNKIEWMHDGIEKYESEGINTGFVLGNVVKLAKEGGIPTISELRQNYFSLSYNNGLSYSLIGFILGEYGPQSLHRLIETPQDVKGVFGLSESQFREKWVEYILENYK